MKDDMESASEIVKRAWKHSEWKKSMKVKQRKLYQAGVDRVPNPDGPGAHRDLPTSAFGRIMAESMGIRMPDGYFDSDVQVMERDDLEMSRQIAAHMPEDDGTDLCGYCGHSKKRGEWCENRRCKSQTKRRRE